ncbi:MAG: hypothetical protein AUJ96_31475 [Armatimonadetes bacterium CG2_30_66_41]|nr:MAG: hypothetical protein AUJ96_31475 [Armatimonadetes bacterium CG2_30_66_41]
MDPRLQTNRLAWDERATIHAGGAYPVEAFKAGRVEGITPLPDDLGEVPGKSLLHLQCHIGLDTLTWARRGARVTGVDFSPVALREAQNLADELGLYATFVASDIAELPGVLAGEFDIVLTYYGTITRLPDLTAWARTIHHFLKPGGFLHLADTHPFAAILEAPKGGRRPEPAYDYFNGGKSLRIESAGGTSADPSAATAHRVTYQWLHPLQEVLGSLLDAGLRLDYLHEFPFTFYNLYYYENEHLMRQDEDGWWHPVDSPNRLPLMFSVKASKE